MKFGKRFGGDVVASALRLLPSNDRKKIAAVVVIQVFMSGIDLVAVALIGVLGSLTVSGVSSQAPGDRVSQVINFFQLEGFSFQVQAALIGIIAVGLLVTRTALSIFFSKKTLLFWRAEMHTSRQDCLRNYCLNLYDLSKNEHLKRLCTLSPPALQV